MTQHQHLTDYLRIIYKRRWTVGLVFVLVFAYGAMTSLRKVSIVPTPRGDPTGPFDRPLGIFLT